LIQRTRGRSSDSIDRNIDVQMSRLRKNLVERGFPEEGFKTVRNAGYVLTALVKNAS
jgi:DNA-binding response OmpR family regulator